MKKDQKGFTLLEAIFAILFLGILMSGLMQFFHTIYINSRNFQDQSYAMDNARNANTLIQKTIREASYVTIQVKDVSGQLINLEPGSDSSLSSYYGSITPLPGTELSSSYSSTATSSDREGTLSRILIKNEDGTYSALVLEPFNTTNPGQKDPSDPNANNKGAYKLTYKTYDAAGTLTSSLLVTELIQSMHVKMKADSSYVTFDVKYMKMKEAGKNEAHDNHNIVNDSFSESLNYKYKVY